MVLEIPPADGGSITGAIMDAWQAALEDVGPAGVDQGKGGKIPDPVSRLQRRAAERLHRAAVHDLSGLRLAALQSRDSAPRARVWLQKMADAMARLDWQLPRELT